MKFAAARARARTRARIARRAYRGIAQRNPSPSGLATVVIRRISLPVIDLFLARSGRISDPRSEHSISLSISPINDQPSSSRERGPRSHFPRQMDARDYPRATPRHG